MGGVLFTNWYGKGKEIQMGISDRDYMREPHQDPKLRKPKAKIHKAVNKPPLLKRLQFWIWNLKNR